VSVPKPVYYKDVRVAPNSALYAALQDVRNSNLTDTERRAAGQRAKAIYDECEREYRKCMKL
jgi:hypothetical protein